MLAITHPHADVPVIQVSIRADFDPEAHLRLGRALAPLRDEGVVIVGSGSSYHNLTGSRNAAEASARFDEWLTETLVGAEPERRSWELSRWTDAPFARDAHPEEDHLMPLHVALGAAEHEPAQVIYHQADFFDQWTVSSFQFGES
jgi:aromatic ring-opening dioxygenase catalytic subunit (LigB family)